VTQIGELLVARPGEIDVGRHHVTLVGRGGDQPTLGVDDDRPRGPRHRAFGAGAIATGDSHPIYACGRHGDDDLGWMLVGGPRHERPIDRHHDEVGAGEGKVPSELRELDVVADGDPDATGRGGHDRWERVTRREPQAFTVPEVGFAIHRRHLAAIDHDEAVVQLAVAAPFAESADHAGRRSGTSRSCGPAVEDWMIQGHGDRLGFFDRLEDVTGCDQLGQHHHVCSVGDRRGDRIGGEFNVAGQVAHPRRQLAAGHYGHR